MFAMLFFCICSLFSCVREEIVPYNNKGESKIVVIGLLTPAANIEIYVGKSQPFGKPSYMPADFIEKNAIVTIIDEVGNTKLLNSSISFPSIYSCPQSEFPIIAGKNMLLLLKAALEK